jgi:hypothetical protein
MELRKLVSTATVALLALPALAAGAVGGLSGEVVPYLWAAGIDGDVSVRGQEVDVDVGFGDLVDKVDIGGSALGVLRYDRWVLWGQVDYFSLSSDELGGRRGRQVDSELETNSLIWTLAVGYQFAGRRPGQTVDVLIGARQLSLENELTLAGLGTFKRDKDFIDAILVVRPNLPLSDRVVFNLILSVGSGASDLTWELWPQLEFRLAAPWVAQLGYRRLQYDIDGGNGNSFDAAFHGLTLGLGARF